jgi:hypothetical protein
MVIGEEELVDYGFSKATHIESVYGTPCAAWQNEVEYHSY